MTRFALIFLTLVAAGYAATGSGSMTAEEFAKGAAKAKARQQTIDALKADTATKPAPKILTEEEKKALAARIAFNQAQNTPGARTARSPQGLLIERWKYLGNGRASVSLRNFRKNPVRFDHRQLLGAELDTAAVVAATDVQFGVKENASYDVEAGKSRTFNVRFNGREVAALGWQGVSVWVESSGTVVAQHATAAAEIRARYAERQVAQRNAKMIQVKDGYVANPGN